MQSSDHWRSGAHREVLWLRAINRGLLTSFLSGIDLAELSFSSSASFSLVSSSFESSASWITTADFLLLRRAEYVVLTDFDRSGEEEGSSIAFYARSVALDG